MFLQHHAFALTTFHRYLCGARYNRHNHVPFPSTSTPSNFGDLVNQPTMPLSSRARTGRGPNGHSPSNSRRGINVQQLGGWAIGPATVEKAWLFFPSRKSHDTLLNWHSPLRSTMFPSSSTLSASFSSTLSVCPPLVPLPPPSFLPPPFPLLNSAQQWAFESRKVVSHPTALTNSMT